MLWRADGSPGLTVTENGDPLIGDPFKVTLREYPSARTRLVENLKKYFPSVAVLTALVSITVARYVESGEMETEKTSVFPCCWFPSPVMAIMSDWMTLPAETWNVFPSKKGFF